jgi:hypothetical protein
MGGIAVDEKGWLWIASYMRKPPNPTGQLDNYLAINCNRDPGDGLFDVWTEDNLNQRLIWYRVGDRDIETFEGKFEVDALELP